MKTFSRIIAVLAVVLSFASCEKDPQVVNQEPEGTIQERDIFYSVSQTPGMPSFSGTTKHLTTEAEWDSLLDYFCDMTSNGDQVTFYTTSSNSTVSKSAGSKTTTTITTQNREELKAWMKEMEKEGKTVNVTFDKNSGTWHGTAYTCLNPEVEEAQELTCTGTLALVGIPVIDEPIPGTVWAIQTDDNDTYILTVFGMMLLSEGEEATSLFDGVEFTVSGMVSSHTDINGAVFQTLDLNASVENQKK